MAALTVFACAYVSVVTDSSWWLTQALHGRLCGNSFEVLSSLVH